jgi:aminoacrylate hydrolase
MPNAEVAGCRIHYEVAGKGDPLLMLSGLGGVGRAWGPLINMLAEHYLTIVPDHRGTGASDAPPTGYTIEQHAADMAGVLAAVDCGPAHVLGSSTGGAIAQQMALDHRSVVRSIVVASSWARPDDFFRHQFAARKRILLEAGPGLYTATSALFLYSPQFFRDHYDQVAAWVAAAGAGTRDAQIMAKRIDMIVDFDESRRLGAIDVPTLILVGDGDACTPPYFSKELAGLIPNARYQVLAGGHLIYKEAPDAFFAAVHGFLSQISGKPDGPAA